MTYDNIPDTIESSFNIRNRDYREYNPKYHIPNVSSELLLYTKDLKYGIV